MLKQIQKRLRRDRGDSSLVSIIIVLPLLLGLLFTIFDISAYFANRAYIQTVSNNGARTVGIMGGNGNGTQSTSIEAKYGMTRAETCSKVDKNLRAGEAASNLSASTAVECNMMIALQEASGLVNVTIQKVKCTPSITNAIGMRTSCEIQWTYGGTPGSGMSLLKLGQKNTTAGSSASEVDLSGSPLVTRK